jgi:hypothetical protein
MVNDEQAVFATLADRIAAQIAQGQIVHVLQVKHVAQVLQLIKTGVELDERREMRDELETGEFVLRHGQIDQLGQFELVVLVLAVIVDEKDLIAVQVELAQVLQALQAVERLNEIVLERELFQFDTFAKTFYFAYEIVVERGPFQIDQIVHVGQLVKTLVVQVQRGYSREQIVRLAIG